MPANRKQPVVVITGATSGIGRATAHAFAKRGAALVLGARREQLLERTAEECRGRGADVVTVAFDVADEPSVRTLAGAALERFGRIDMWVNNASVRVWGRVDEIPIEDIRHLLDVNLLGYVHGAGPCCPSSGPIGREP